MYLKIVVSNQTFAARKKMNYIKFRFFTYTFFKSLIKLGLLDDFAICYHHPNAKNFFLQKKCDCRKPLPGLINLMVEKHNISQYVSKITAEKPRAEIYIDDNGYRFENWVDTLNFIKSYEQL
jgi:D-glycero-D-manno-heptose 1,7-bisphosphate phosphatase